VVAAVEVAEAVVEEDVEVVAEVPRVREQGSLPREVRHVRRDPARVLDRALAAPQRLPPGPQVRQPPRKAEPGPPAVRPLRALEQHSGQRKLAVQQLRVLEQHSGQRKPAVQRRRIGLPAQDHRRGRSISSSMSPDPRPARSVPRVQRPPDEQAAQRPIFYKEEARSWPPEQQSAVPP